MNKRFSIFFVIAALCSHATALASGEKSVAIPRIDAAPLIDGAIEPDEWSRAARVSDMHQVVPVEYSAPSEETLWFLAYNDRYLFVAARAMDSDPGAVIAKTLRQGGSIGSDDSLHILVDPFNNKRSGYSFALNANGVRSDAIYTDGTRQSNDWEGIWRGAARRTEDGWSMEMAIPFTTLNFDPDITTWGLNLWRQIPRRDETIAWQSQNARINPTVSGEASGLRDLSQGKGLDIILSMSGTGLNDREAGITESDANPSLDINYKLTNSINALLTVNTDFAATEVDNRQLGLQRFSLFFPEKRSFFLTDFDIFQFGGIPSGGGRGSAPVGVRSGNNGMPFFSRRIGLSADRAPVDVEFGTKVSGRLAGLDFGSLYIRQEAHDDIEAKDLVVARVARGILEESVIGAIGTWGDPNRNGDSSLLGLDFSYRNTRLANNRSLESQWWIQKSSNEGSDGDDLAYSVSLSFPARVGLELGAQYHVVEENFRPALGFANRTGVRLYGATAVYNHALENPRRLREVETELQFERWEYLDTGRVQSQEIEASLIKLRSVVGDFFRVHVKHQEEGLLTGEQPLRRIGITIPEGDYTFERVGTFLRTAEHRPFSFELRIEDGGFYNGDRLDISPGLEWRPNEHFAMGFDFDYRRYDFPGISRITRQMTLEAEFAFNARLSLTTLTQYDNLSNDVGINARFRYNLEAGRDIWFVLNHNMVDDPLENRFRSTTSAAAVKIRYTFRY